MKRRLRVNRLAGVRPVRAVVTCKFAGDDLQAKADAPPRPARLQQGQQFDPFLAHAA
ncbi:MULTISPECIES: hypothetical protein [Cupriavidus]